MAKNHVIEAIDGLRGKRLRVLVLLLRRTVVFPDIKPKPSYVGAYEVVRLTPIERT